MWFYGQGNNGFMLVWETLVFVPAFAAPTDISNDFSSLGWVVLPLDGQLPKSQSVRVDK